MTVIERVAASLGGYNKRKWATLENHFKEYWMNQARNAIAAMREPTDAMVDAGRQALRDGGLMPVYTDRGRGGQPPIMWVLLQEGAWPAMIDAALKE